MYSLCEKLADGERSKRCCGHECVYMCVRAGVRASSRRGEAVGDSERRSLNCGVVHEA